MSDTDTVFIEWESEGNDPPVSWFVTATPEQYAEIERVVMAHVPDDLRPYVGTVIPVTFESFMADFKDTWFDDEEEDVPAVHAGD